MPILSGWAAPLDLEWHHLEHGLPALSRDVLAAGPWGLFPYGLLNRILIVTGLRHILDSIAWFMLGNYHGVTGDPTAGNIMPGFFPVMMPGRPAAHSTSPALGRPIGKCA